jgi:hypothetical protein
MSCEAASTCQMGGRRKHSRPMRSTRKNKQQGGGCGCGSSIVPRKGGYRPTRRNLAYRRLWKKGKSIGFTMLASLKAKGLIPRSNGTLRVSNKYR